MTDRPTPTGSGGATERGTPGHGWRTIAGWLLAVVGGTAILLGAVILLAGADQYVGLGGDLSWRVGDIEPTWTYVLLVGGVVLVLGGLGLAVIAPPVPRAATDDRERRDLLLHATAFILVNAFLWIQDVVVGGGVEYAYWVTIPWGLGLAVHVVAYYLSAHRHPPEMPLPR